MEFTLVLFPYIWVVLVVAAVVLWVKDKQKMALWLILVAMLLMVLGSPVKLKVDNSNREEIRIIEERHSNVPEKVVVERKTFEEKLKNQDEINRPRMKELENEADSSSN